MYGLLNSNIDYNRLQALLLICILMFIVLMEHCVLAVTMGTLVMKTNMKYIFRR